MIIYLAGGLKNGWQDKIIPFFPNHIILDPRKWQETDPAIYTSRDLMFIRKADCVLAYMSSDNPSGFGLSVEIGYAYGLGKRIIFWDGINTDWRSRYFDMHRQITTVCYSIEEVVKEVLK